MPLSTLGRALVAGVVVTLSLAGGSVCSADDPERGAASPEHPLSASRLAANARHLVTRPFHTDRRGRIRIAAVAATTLALYGLRDEIRDTFREHPSAGRSDVLDAARTMGKGAFAPALALTVWAASKRTDDPRGREAAALVLQSAAYSSLVAGAGRFVLATDRPRDGNTVRLFGGGGHGVSTDASLAASVVVPLRRIYLRVEPDDGRGRRFWKRTATGFLYTGAIMAGLQRIDSDAHWAPDVFLGLANGFAVGGALCDASGIPRARAERWSLVPISGGLVVRFVLPPTGSARLR